MVNSFNGHLILIKSLSHGSTVPSGPEPLFADASLSYSDTPHSVGLLWTSDQPHAETALNNHERRIDIHASFERTIADSRLRQLEHRVRQPP